MDILTKLSQDKATLSALKEFMQKTLEEDIVKKTLKGEDVSGYAEAHRVVTITLDKVDRLYKLKESNNTLNQAM